MATVDLNQVTKEFPGGVRVLDQVSLHVDEGEFLVLVGPSGCGKSTLLRIIAGLEDATAGTVLVDGESVDGVPPKERDVAMVFQNYALYPHMSVRGNLAFSLRLRHVPTRVRDRRVGDTAELLGIEELLDRKPKALSGGQRQRVATGRAIVRQPRILLMDEPLSNLDAQLRVTMRAELRRLHLEHRTTTIYVTHDQVEAMTLGDRIAVLADGRVQQVGTPHELYHRPVNAFVAGFIGSPSMNLAEVRVTDTDPPTLDVGGQRWPAPATQALAAGPVLLGVRPDAFSWPPAADTARLETTVVAVEFLGNASLVFFPPPGRPWHPAGNDAGETAWVARLDGRGTPRVGQRLALGVDVESAYLFDADNGRAIPVGPAPVPVPA